MVKGVYDELKKASPKESLHHRDQRHVTHTSLDYDPAYSAEIPARCARCSSVWRRCTVGANKNSIKIIGEETDNFAQGYFSVRLQESGYHHLPLRFGPHRCAPAT